MNKYVALVLILAIILSTASCGIPENTSVTESTINATTNPQSTETTAYEDISILQLPMVSVAMPIITETLKNDNGDILFSYTHQSINLVSSESNVVNNITLDFLTQTDSTSYVDQLSAQAKHAYSDNPSEFIPYWFQNTYSPMRIDRSVLSLYGSCATYSGGAHGSYSYNAFNYSMATGDRLKLEQIFKNDISADHISELVTETLATQAAEKHLFENFEVIIANLIEENFTENMDWYFSDSGLCFFFSPYEIAPFSSGDIIAEIPYGKLTEYLNDSFFPPEKDDGFGKIQATILKDADLDQYNQFSEITFQEGGYKVLLHTDGLLYDIFLSAINSSQPEQSCTVLAMQNLTPGDAIMIDIPISNEPAVFRLLYRKNANIIDCKIEIDTNTNKITLTQ